MRWTAVSSIHLTLKFLGAVSADRLESIQQALVIAAQGHQVFDLTLRGMGGFPSANRPRIVWAGISGQLEALIALRDAVEAQIAPLGFPTEARPFSPHVTLGRLKDHVPDSRARGFGDGLRALAADDRPLADWRVSVVSLMHSDLRPNGAVYRPLLDVPLVAV
jgi:2'-5' RNA ligase